MKKLTALVIAVITLFAAVASCKGKAPAKREESQDGYYAVLKTQNDLSDDEIDRAMTSVKGRLAAVGFENATCEKVDGKTIKVTVLGYENANYALQYIGRSGKFELKTSGETILTYADCESVGTGYDKNATPALRLTLSAAGQEKIREATLNAATYPKKLFFCVGSGELTSFTVNTQADTATILIPFDKGAKEAVAGLSAAIADPSDIDFITVNVEKIISEKPFEEGLTF